VLHNVATRIKLAVRSINSSRTKQRRQRHDICHTEGEENGTCDLMLPMCSKAGYTPRHDDVLQDARSRGIPT
jgi:hypothetical protein